MKLLTKAIEARFKSVGVQDGKGDQAVVIAKFFYPAGAATWYATEYDPTDRLFFGFVTGLGHDELGTFSLDELEGFRGRFGLRIERDRFFSECTVGDIREGRAR